MNYKKLNSKFKTGEFFKKGLTRFYHSHIDFKSHGILTIESLILKNEIIFC